MRRPDLGHERGSLRSVAQIGAMPSDTVAVLAGTLAIDRVDFAIFRQQPAQAMSTNKTRWAGDEHPHHKRKSGQRMSFSDMVTGSAGHSIPNAGSFQRTPLASSGT